MGAEEIIQAAVAEAEGNAADSGAESDVGTSDTAESTSIEAAPAAGTAEGQAAAGTETPAPKTLDELDTLIEKHGGVKLHQGREARLPYSRYKEMLGKTVAEIKAANETAIKELREKLTPAEQRAQRLDELEQAADADPEGFVRILARANPAFARFLQQPEAKPTPATPEIPANDPMPGPDLPDGYSAEGLKKWQDWSVRQAERNATAKIEAKMEEKYGPLAKDYQARRLMEERQPVIAARKARLEKTYGDLLKTHEAELVTALEADRAAARRERRQATPAEMIVAEVLMPKIVADRQKIRDEVLNEEKKAAAAKAAASTRTGPAQTGGDSGATALSTEEIIRRESQKLGSIT